MSHCVCMTMMCMFTVHSAEAGESSQSDSCQPSVLSGDSRHCSDVECEFSDASSDSISEECPSPAQRPTSLPVPSDGSASLLDVGVLIHSLDKSMKLKLLKQAPDAKFNYPTKFMHGCNRQFKPEWTQSQSLTSLFYIFCKDRSISFLFPNFIYMYNCHQCS